MPIFRSTLQGELLAATLLDPEAEQSLSELAERLDAPLATVQREVTRLEQASVLRSRKIGNTRLVRADSSAPTFAPLAELVLLSFGPPHVLRNELSRLRGVEEVLIFGSWAARREGASGPPPSDIDVLVVGTARPDDVHEAARRAEKRLKKQVNASIRSRARWERGDDGFLRHVRAQPKTVVWRRPPGRKKR